MAFNNPHWKYDLNKEAERLGLTPQSPPPEEVELDNILDGIVVAAPCGHESYAITETIEIVKTTLLSWREAYADKARIDELKFFTHENLKWEWGDLQTFIEGRIATLTNDKIGGEHGDSK